MIGPIESRNRAPDGYPSDAFYHPGGPAPIWGGYAPRLTSETWEEFCRLAEAGKTLKMYGARWSAHTTDTALTYQPEGWYIEAPSGRLSQRCVRIAEAAIRSGADAELLRRIGLRQDEIAAADAEIRRLHVNPLARQHDSDIVALESFPSGRYVIDGVYSVHWYEPDDSALVVPIDLTLT